MDNDGNIIRTEEFKPPANKLEEIASKLGILKRANTVNSMGFQIAAKRFTGSDVLPVTWVAALDSGNNWQFRSAEATVYSRNVTLSNPVHQWTWDNALTGHYISMGASTSNHAGQIVSTVGSSADPLNVIVHDGSFWIEIEYDFT